jgi:hypothetical protein
MSLSDTAKVVAELSAFSALNNTSGFNYIKVDVDNEDNLKIWYISKETDNNAMISAIAKAIGAYLGVAKQFPDISDAYIFIGTEGNETGSLYCLRSWIPDDGKLTKEIAENLVLKVLGTFKDLS